MLTYGFWCYTSWPVSSRADSPALARVGELLQDRSTQLLAVRRSETIVTYDMLPKLLHALHIHVAILKMRHLELWRDSVTPGLHGIVEPLEEHVVVTCTCEFSTT